MPEKEGRTGLWRPQDDSGSLPLVLLTLVGFLVFSGTLGHDLVWDDRPIIQYARMTVEDGGITALALVPFAAGPKGSDNSSGYYRPVSLISMWINFPSGEPSPFAYHLGNILLHVINCLLVFQLLKLLLPPGGGALLGSLLFAAHPVHSESVAFVSGRTDLLAALFILFAVLLWQRYGQPTGPTSLLYFTLAMISFFLAGLAKEVAFVLPAVLLLWATAGASRGRDSNGLDIWKRNRWALGLFVVLGIMLFFRFVILDVGAGPGWSGHAQLADASLLSLAGGVGGNILFYLRLMVFPWPLAVFYPPVGAHLTWLTAISALVFTVLCLALSGERHRRIGLISLMWTILFLIPVSGVVGLGQSVIAERFCYIPSIGVVAVLGYALTLLRDKMALKGLHSAVVICVIALFSVGSVLHAARWKDNQILFTNALQAGPVKIATMYLNLGLAYKKAGETALAVQAFEEALRLDPILISALLNLGETQMELGNFEKALEVLNRARQFSPEDPAVWNLSGGALEGLGRMKEALDFYSKATRLNPRESLAFYSKGKLLSGLGRYEESVIAYQGAVLVDENHVRAYISMGRVYEKMGRIDQAVEMFLKAIEVRPDEIISYGDLGRILLETDRIIEAIEVFKMAVALDSHDPIAGKGLVVAYFMAGEGELARAYVASLKPVDAELHDRLSKLIDSLAGPEVK